MEQENNVAFTATPKLIVDLKIDTETWASFQHLSPTAWHLLNYDPDVIAIEILIHPTPSFDMTSAIVVGSPNAWIIDDGYLISAEDIATPEHLSEALWRIGREAGFCGLGPWIQQQNFSKSSLLSVLLLPNLICVRDAKQLEDIAEHTWTDSLKETTLLEATCYTPNYDDMTQSRIRAQIQHLKEIYCADLGTTITLGKTLFYPTRKSLQQNITYPDRGNNKSL